MNDQEDLLIRSKFDVDRAQRLIELGYPGVAPFISNMLEWIQDMNWPVAKKLAPFLAALGEPVVPEIQKVLDGDDLIWKYWCIDLIGEMSNPNAEKFRSQLERLVATPSDYERHEELDEMARSALERMDGQKRPYK